MRLLIALVLATAPALAQPVPTPAYTAAMPAICTGAAPYPALPTWASVNTPPRSAASGTPRIEQWRNGVDIANYTTFDNQPGCSEKGDGSDQANPGPAAASGCGPFARSHAFALWQAGDDFRVYPAVYTGPYNSIYLGQSFVSASDFPNNPVTPANITIEGVVQNNRRPVILLTGGAPDNALGQAPVMLANGSNIVWSGINIQATSTATVGKALMYVDAVAGLDIEDTRISGAYGIGNGLFDTDNFTGLLRLDNVELDHNGGQGDMHNAYLSAQDNNTSVLVRHLYTHDATMGHLFKSRAAVTTVLGSAFIGSSDATGTPGEVYDLDVPNGGNLTVRNSIFVKGHSGAFTNGFSVTFGSEGLLAGRSNRVTLDNNTFAAAALTYDDVHPLAPWMLLYPPQMPTNGFLPAVQLGVTGPVAGKGVGVSKPIPVSIDRNLLVGYCPAALGYTGASGVLAAAADLTAGFRMAVPIAMPGTGGVPVGQEGYRAHAAGAARKTATVGAVD